MMDSRRTLYRKLATAVIIMTVLAAAIPAVAQFRRKREPHKLRAVAALVWPSAQKSSPTLEPLVIFANGRYFDASVYLASPVPLAAQPGVVYEAQKSGAGVGLFTVSVARQVNDSWLAQGTWHEGLEAPRPVVTGKSRRAPVEEPDERPILRKPGSAGGSGTSKPAPPQASPAPSGKTTTPAPSPAKAAPAVEAQPQSDAGDDSGRPVLRRGKPAQGPSEDIPAEIAKATKSTPVPPASSGKPAQPAPPAPKIMLAVSDAQPSQDQRSFLLNWTAQEESQLTTKAVALAQQEIAKWAQFRQQKRGEWPLQDVQVKFFDLLMDNYPEVVLTARQPAGAAPAKSPSRRARPASQKPAASETRTEAAPDVYVTLVARGDLDGNLRTLFSNITDARHLDVSPRLELLDAVDADGEGYGELLFHKVWGASTPLEGNVVLYRVGPDNLVELFDASPPQ